MQCTSPNIYDRDGYLKPHTYPCGKCLSCRTRQRREWAARLVLEARCWHNSLFFTLTYNEENLPEDGLLSKVHIRNFIQNWSRQQGHTPRYFICGEYGTLNHRPHYHGIFFGEDPKLTQQATHLKDLRFEKAWNKGFTDIRDFSASKYQNSVVTYVAGYVLKGSWRKDNLPTSRKEWALMSRRPAIAAGAAEKIVSALTTRSGVELLSKLGTAPARFKYGGKSWIMPYRVRKDICSLLDIPFKPLIETIQLDIETGKVNNYGPKKKTLAEAQANEKRLSTILNRPKHSLS